MKKQNDGGFSLIEVLVAMVMLAAIVVPTCTSLVLSTKVNQKADALMKAKLAVSSAVETLMAEGVDNKKVGELTIDVNGVVYDTLLDDGTNGVEDRFPDVTVTIMGKDDNTGAYLVYVEDNDKLVSVNTYIRATGGAS